MTQRCRGTEKDTIYRLLQRHSSSLRAKDLYANFNFKRCNITVKEYRQMHASSKRLACARIFTEAFFKIIDDIVDNNITLRIPVYEGKEAHIGMEAITGDDFERMYLRGDFGDLDPVTSNFTGYRPYISYTSWNGNRHKQPLRISKNWLNKITEHLNNGKVYY